MSFYIVETKEQLNNLFVPQKAFVNIIPKNSQYHPLLQEISLIYVRPLGYPKGFIFCVDHFESLKLEISDIKHYLFQINEIYVLDKKAFNQTFLPLNNVIDINILNTLYEYKTIDYSIYDLSLERIYNRHINPNIIIPISKHFEKNENIFFDVESIIEKYDPKDTRFDFYNTILSNNFEKIEKNGIQLNKNEYVKHYKENIKNHEYFIKNGKIYTKYNLYNQTTRPSNSFNGINFAAIPKGEIRKSFTCSNDRLIEIDIHAYHPSIISRLINHPFDYTKNIYEQLADEMKLTDLNDVKTKVFRQLYGGVRKEYKHIPFYSKLDEYVHKLWNSPQPQFIFNGKPFKHKNINNVTPNKLLNYVLQNGETILNAVLINNILSLLSSYKTKIILYTYDSILLDYCEQDQILEEIIKCFPFKTTIKSGLNYCDLQKH